MAVEFQINRKIFGSVLRFGYLEPLHRCDGSLAGGNSTKKENKSRRWQDKCLISLAAWFNLYSELGLSKIYGYFLPSQPEPPLPNWNICIFHLAAWTRNQENALCAKAMSPVINCKSFKVFATHIEKSFLVLIYLWPLVNEQFIHKRFWRDLSLRSLWILKVFVWTPWNLRKNF